MSKLLSSPPIDVQFQPRPFHRESTRAARPRAARPSRSAHVHPARRGPHLRSSDRRTTVIPHRSERRMLDGTFVVFVAKDSRPPFKLHLSNAWNSLEPNTTTRGNKNLANQTWTRAPNQRTPTSTVPIPSDALEVSLQSASIQEQSNDLLLLPLRCAMQRRHPDQPRSPPEVKLYGGLAPGGVGRPSKPFTVDALDLVGGPGWTAGLRVFALRFLGLRLVRMKEKP